MTKPAKIWFWNSLYFLASIDLYSTWSGPTYIYKFCFHYDYPGRNHVLFPRNVLIHEPKCKHFLWNFYLFAIAKLEFADTDLDDIWILEMIFQKLILDSDQFLPLWNGIIGLWGKQNIFFWNSYYFYLADKEILTKFFQGRRNRWSHEARVSPELRAFTT